MTLAIPGPDRAERLGLFRSVLYPVDEAVDEEIRSPASYLLPCREDAHPDPGAFRPERFPGQPGSTYTWISFGERVCRGLGASFALMEMRGVLQALARRGELHPSGRSASASSASDHALIAPTVRAPVAAR